MCVPLYILTNTVPASKSDQLATIVITVILNSNSPIRVSL